MDRNFFLSLGCLFFLPFMVSCAHISTEEGRTASFYKQAREPSSSEEMSSKSWALFHFLLAEQGSFEHYGLSIAHDPNVCISRYRKLYISEKFKKASSEAEQDEVLRLCSSYAPAYFLVASLKLRQGHMDQAKDLYLKVMKMKPEHSASALLYLGIIEFQQENYAKARALLKKSLKQEPSTHNEAMAERLIAQTYIEQNNSAKALSWSKKSFKTKPEFGTLEIVLALLPSGFSSPEALPYFEEFRQHHPNHTFVNFHLAKVYNQQGKMSQLLSVLLDLERTLPQNPSLKEQIAVVLLSQKRYKEGLKYLYQVQPPTGKTFYLMGLAYRQQNLKSQAVEAFSNVSDTDELAFDAHVHLFSIYLDQKKSEPAMASLLKAVHAANLGQKKLSFSFIQACVNSLGESGFWNLSREFLQVVHPLFPNHISFSYLQAIVHVKEDRVDLALPLLSQVLEKNPNHVEALNTKAYLLAEQGKDLDLAYSLALKALKVSLEKEPPHILDTLGWILFKKKDYGRAHFYLEKAMRFGGGDLEIQSHWDQLLKAGPFVKEQQSGKVSKDGVNTDTQRAPASDSKAP